MAAAGPGPWVAWVRLRTELVATAGESTSPEWWQRIEGPALVRRITSPCHGNAQKRNGSSRSAVT